MVHLQRLNFMPKGLMGGGVHAHLCVCVCLCLVPSPVLGTAQCLYKTETCLSSHKRKAPVLPAAGEILCQSFLTCELS